jgi:AcrR family transcriptional regulator
MTSRRDRLIAEGMRLFGEKGYAATSVAEIEKAAGLSPGSGSLYKHFHSKQELLEAGLDRLLESRNGMPGVDGHAAEPADRLHAAARAGLKRLDQDRDVSRLLFRDLDAFPDLLRRFGDEEIKRAQRRTTAMLADLAGEGGEAVDWSAVAAVLQGATTHYWLMRDLFGRHPTGVSEKRFVAALVAMTMAMLDRAAAREDRDRE